MRGHRSSASGGWTEALLDAADADDGSRVLDVTAIPAAGHGSFAPGGFDVVVDGAGVRDPSGREAVLREAFRVLRPGGRIAFAVCGPGAALYDRSRHALLTAGFVAPHARRLPPGSPVASSAARYGDRHETPPTALLAVATKPWR